jgi:Ulp1 family protease
MERMERNGKFKVLPAHQFYLVRETKKDKLIFKELLNQIKDFKGELVFIPVNNPNFHWSLLVYEVSEKKFWHFDSLGGANWEYVESLCKGLLENIWQRKEVELEKYLIAKNDIRQENGYDCGIAVIAITKRIIKL